MKKKVNNVFMLDPLGVKIQTANVAMPATDYFPL